MSTKTTFTKRNVLPDRVNLISYTITDDCGGCTLCAKHCPVDAISGKVKEKHVIDQSLCIKCGKCMDTCNFGAIEKK